MKSSDNKVISNSKSSDNEDVSNFTIWIHENWLKILIYFIAIILILGLVKSLSQLFNGPLGKGITDLTGAAANIVTSVTNGCSKQPDCSLAKDKENCPTKGCAWTPPKTNQDTGSCFNNTGRKHGSGGFFSLQCGLGIGFLAYLGALILAPLVKILAMRFGVKSENIKNESRLSGKGLEETLREAVKEIQEKVKDAKENFKEEMTPEKELYIEKIVTSKVLKDRIESAADDSGMNYEEKNEARNRASEISKREIEDAKKEAIDNGANENDLDIINDHVDKIMENK